MQYRTLGKTGLRVSVLGLGTSPFGGVFGDTDLVECKACLDRALEMGINLIDCSPFYGLTKAETMLGQTLQGVRRDSYYLATKVGRYGPDVADFDFSAERVTKSVEESLKRLGVDHIDIIQCHDIEFGSLDQIVEETIPALRKVVEAGKARFVGITGLPLKVFSEVTSRVPVDTVLSYCRHSLNDTSLTRILPSLHAQNIGVMNAAPFSMGLLTQRGAPDWHPASPQIKAACRQAAAHCRAKGASLEKLAIQFAVANPDIATTFVGTSKAQDIEHNARWTEEPIEEELLAEVLEILAPVQNQSWPSGCAQNHDD